MTQDEQKSICKTVAKVCMWGQGGIASCLIEDLDKALPMGKSWRKIYDDNAKQARFEAVGVVKDEEELRFWLSRGYWLCNYSPGELSLFNPPPMNGLCKYVLGELADKYGERHDSWNFRIYQKRATANQP